MKCVAYHEAYPRRTMEETTTLDVLYAPIVKLEPSKSGFEFEADIDQLQIRCLADSNPPSNIFWRKAGGESILRYTYPIVHTYSLGPDHLLPLFYLYK